MARAAPGRGGSRRVYPRGCRRLNLRRDPRYGTTALRDHTWCRCETTPACAIGTSRLCPGHLGDLKHFALPEIRPRIVTRNPEERPRGSLHVLHEDVS